MKIFISYASEDLNLFRIPEIAPYLENQPEIQKVYYWERDNNSNMIIVEYMEQSILDSDIVLAISSPNSLASTPFKIETDFAIIRKKIIIPIFQEITNVRPFLTIFRGVEYNSNNFNEFLDKLMQIITGDTSSILPQRSSQELEVQELFDRLKRLITKLLID